MSSVFLSNMLRRWLKVFMWSRSSCWKLACLVSRLGVNRGGSLLTVLLGAPSVERVVRLAESRVLVKTTAVPTVVVHLRPSPPPPPPSTSSSSSSPLPPPPTSFSQLKLNTASAPHPSGSSSSREGSPQLSEDGRASLKVRTTESGMWVNHHTPPTPLPHLCSAKIDWSDRRPHKCLHLCPEDPGNTHRRHLQPSLAAKQKQNTNHKQEERKVLGLYNVSRSTPLLEEVRPRWSPTNCSPRKDL